MVSRRRSKSRRLPQPAAMMPADLDQRRAVQQAAHCPTADKIPFPDQGSAVRAAGKRQAMTGAALRAYQCVCGFWHLTSQPENDRFHRRAAIWTDNEGTR